MATDNTPNSSPNSSLHEESSSQDIQYILRERAWFKRQIRRERAWTNQDINHNLGRHASITHGDLDEVRGCLELGIEFKSPVDKDSKLLKTLPGLESCLNSSSTSDGTRLRSDSECFSELKSVATSTSFIEPGEDPESVKRKLKEWAKIVGSSMRRLSEDIERRERFLEDEDDLESEDFIFAKVFL